MTRVVVIGGSGHVGTYLVPRLVEAGFEVVNVARGERQPYQPHGAWKSVETRDPRPRGGREGRRVRREDRRRQAGHRHRHDLLQARQRQAPRRGAARQGPAFPPLRHDLGAWPERHGADHRDAAAPALRRIRHPEGGDRGVPDRRGPRRRLSRDHRPSRPYRRAGLGAAQPGRPFQPAGLRHPRARATSWRCRISASKPCTMSMPTTWRRCS